MKKKFTKIFICLFVISLFGFITTRGATAEEFGACECVVDISFTVGACSECTAGCAASYEAEGRPFTVKSCEDSPIPGAKECFCHLTTESIRREECRIGCVGYTYNFTPAAGPVPVDIGDTCARKEDCVGTAGDCGATSCFCNATTSRCTFKKDAGSVCSENFECNSNICTPVPGGEGKTCKFGGLTPPGEEVTPPPTGEEDIFPTYQINSPIGEITGPQLIGRIIKAILGLVGALALAMFVYGGFTWLTSAGSPDKIKKGKDILIWATIGLIVIFTSYTLVDFLLRSFGL